MAHLGLVPKVDDGNTSRAIAALKSSLRQLIVEQDAGNDYSMVTVDSDANVTLDGSKSSTYKLEMNKNIGFANPTGMVEGQVVSMSITQDSTGSRIATWGTAWKFEGGSSTLSTAASSIDLLVGRVESVDDSGATLILCSLNKAHA